MIGKPTFQRIEYLSVIIRVEQYFTGKHRPLVDRRTFSQCQDLLDGKIRRTTTQINMPLAGYSPVSTAAL